MQAIFPLTNIPIWVEIASASLILWVVKIALPLLNFIVWFNDVNKDFFDMGSTPLEGSSRNNRLVPPINEQANESLRLFPPDKLQP